MPCFLVVTTSYAVSLAYTSNALAVVNDVFQTTLIFFSVPPDAVVTMLFDSVLFICIVPLFPAILPAYTALEVNDLPENEVYWVVSWIWFMVPALVITSVTSAASTDNALIINDNKNAKNKCFLMNI